MQIDKEFKKWLDAYGKNRSLRSNKKQRIYLCEEETGDFNGKSLTEISAIVQKLLTKYGDVIYEEHWTGYEDMYPTLTWNEQESELEYQTRIESLHEMYLEEKDNLQKQEERTKLEMEIKSLQDKINKLKV